MSTFKQNLLLGYGVSLLLLLLSGIASFISITRLIEAQHLVEHTATVIKKVENIRLAVREGEAGQRGYLLTMNEEFLLPYRGANDRALNLASEIAVLTADNQAQQQVMDDLKDLIQERFAFMDFVIKRRLNNNVIDSTGLERGHQAQLKLWSLLNEFEGRERRLLVERTEATNAFAAATPVLIVVASLLALVVTVVSFLRVNADFKERQQLQADLEKRNFEISERIRVTEDITSRIASGDFSVRAAGRDAEVLGVLGPSLNKMAEALDRSFTDLADNEWQQAGIAELNKLMIGQRDLEQLTSRIIQYLTQYTGSGMGAFYLAVDEETMNLESSVNLNTLKARRRLKCGEGLAGQAAESREVLLLQPVDHAELTVDFSGGGYKPAGIIAVPILFDSKFKGVIELASLQPYSPIMVEFLTTAAYNIGMAINAAKDHLRLQELLHETQAQSEELQAQHSELENINAELEAQAEKLQASEEELRVQQEELQQANTELEERSKMLEEKNATILERNLEIQHKVDELAQSTRYKSEFLANMSHELRTPLNSILLLSRLLSENHDGNLNEEQIEFMTVIESSGKGLLTLIDEILDLSKIEAGKMELEWKEVQVKPLANELKSMFEPIARDKSLDFRIVISETTPETLETDKLRLEQVLRNLLSNALKFTREGSVALEIEGEDDAIKFTVRDTGIGIPADKQAIVFEAFKQADGSTRRNFGGTGLGLSISRQLATLLGGTITLSSTENVGSAFTLTLPAKHGTQIQTISDEAVKEIQVQTSPPDEYISEVIPSGIEDDRNSILEGDRVILIIEDDVLFAKALLDYTRSKGYKGVVGVRGDEGLPLALRFQPSGILLDVQLPVKSGWQVMEDLKGNVRTRPIPVHMMSSHEVRHQSLTQGAVDFINKPIAFERLGDIFEKIEQALSKSPKKVLIVEENPKHAQALALFLEGYKLSAEIKNNVSESIDALQKEEVDCVILDMGVPAQRSYELLEKIKNDESFDNLPIIVFTGQNLSPNEEAKLRQYADSIVVKTVNSYQRILDEVSLFLHLVEVGKGENGTRKKSMGTLTDVLRGKNILVADDDVRNIFSLSRSLENFGVNVISAIDGKDALKQLEEHPDIDLVLMDMMMPEMDGYQSTKIIRRNPKFRKLPIIAVTAKAMTGDREKCIAAGASDYITKPVDIDQLISLLRVWLYQ